MCIISLFAFLRPICVGREVQINLLLRWVQMHAAWLGLSGVADDVQGAEEVRGSGEGKIDRSNLGGKLNWARLPKAPEVIRKIPNVLL